MMTRDFFIWENSLPFVGPDTTQLAKHKEYTHYYKLGCR
ncbi:hypothetical protein S7335_783 [Synechococcus sp. PCC 7335]|nr:hypothetical protein S7335_783 [Synechococcus sp. PCC 7335]